jgi:hypothetical protein
LVEGVELSQWAPHLIGRLYNAHPEVYAEVVAQLLLQRDWHPTIQLLYWLDITHEGVEKPPIQPVVVDAMLRRVRELYTTVYGETEVLDVLASVAPQLPSKIGIP